ncbi:MAG TPA: SDR family NAD(P)-dependent oxidoreductase, partial [Planctomycetaceae bacterium]
MAESTRGKVVVLTGASSGIGRAAALELARRGANLVLAARRDEALDEVAAECERIGVTALAVPTDVSNEEDVRELARRAIERFGGFDVWVNDAGVYLQGRFEKIPPADFRRVFETNFFGVVQLTGAVVPAMRERGSGRIVVISSNSAHLPMPLLGPYT